MSKITKLIENLGVDSVEPYKIIQKEKEFCKVKDQVNLSPNFNQMADVLYLPTAQRDYKYMLCVCDLATNKFDIEPLKYRDSDAVLKALQKIYEREFLKEPKYTLKTDSGVEFKGVFHKWLYDKSIYHKIAPQGFHKGLSNIENLNKLIGRIIMTYLANKDLKTGKVNRNWLPIVPSIRKNLNELRNYKLPKDINSHVYPLPYDSEIVATKKKKPIYKRIKPKFKEGDDVYYYLTTPTDNLGKKQKTPNRRQGDRNWSMEPTTITDVVMVNGGKNCYRYILEDVKGRSFIDKELKKHI